MPLRSCVRLYFQFQLPYSDTRLSLIVILPERKDDANPIELLQNVEKQLTSTTLENITEVFRMRRAEVNVGLPKFK